MVQEPRSFLRYDFRSSLLGLLLVVLTLFGAGGLRADVAAGRFTINDCDPKWSFVWNEDKTSVQVTFSWVMNEGDSSLSYEGQNIRSSDWVFVASLYGITKDQAKAKFAGWPQSSICVDSGGGWVTVGTCPTSGWGGNWGGSYTFTDNNPSPGKTYKAKAEGYNSAFDSWAVWVCLFFYDADEITSPPLPVTKYRLTIEESGPGHHSVSGAGDYNPNDSANVTASWDGTTTQFSGFSGDESGAGPTLSVVMDRSKTIKAPFNWRRYSLTTKVVGGGTVQGGGQYNYGETATVQAIDQDGLFSRFDGTSSQPVLVGAGVHSSTVYMDGDKEVTAVFDTVAESDKLLRIVVVGNGSVTGSGWHKSNKLVSMVATPDTDWEFNGFSGDVNSSNASETVLMNDNKNVVATFKAKPVVPPVRYTLSTSSNGPGSISGGGTYDAGQSVLVAASWDGSSAVFDGFSGDLGGNSNPQWITVDRDKSVTANFSPKPADKFVVTINVNGPGSVSGGGSYSPGSSVWVSASWNAANAVFNGYSGDLSGTTASQLLHIDGDKNITANFEAKLEPPVPGTGTIALRSFDKQDRSRTMDGVPYKVTYTTSGAGLFAILRAGSVVLANAAGGGSYLQTPVGPGAESLVLVWASKIGDPWTPIASATMTVQPKPSVVAKNLPGVVTDWPNPPTATVQLQNLYPGAVTWVQLTDSDGKVWKSAPVIGVTAADVQLVLAEILKGIRRTNNTVQVQVYSDDAVSGWQAAVAAGTDDGSGRAQLLNTPITFVVNVNGVRQITITRL